MKRLLVIIPAYRESLNIERVVNEVFQMRSALPDLQLDCLVVNDGSPDDTGEAAERTNATVIHLPYNLGIGGAVQTGFRWADERTYDIAVQIDGDGQHDPRFLPELVRPILEEKADLVIGSRFLNKKGFQSTWVRRMGIRVFQTVNSLIIGQKITDNTSGFRACNARAISFFANDYPTDYPEPETVILLGLRGFRIVEIPVVMRERQAGVSSISSLASVYYMVKVLLAIFVNIFKKRS